MGNVVDARMALKHVHERAEDEAAQTVMDESQPLTDGEVASKTPTPRIRILRDLQRLGARASRTSDG